MRRTRYWIQRAIKREGALSRQLGIPVRKKIPLKLLKRIVRKRVGQKVRTPAGTKRVTALMRRRAILALTLRRIARRRKRRR
ncbi:hypothetical protein DRJ16_00020 [Candidatus Woesearchaeota archaeon]|nr:MAG: hypothetical protein DRJ16_00020 [Candidatus Woesearchaeota archaeon]